MEVLNKLELKQYDRSAKNRRLGEACRTIRAIIVNRKDRSYSSGYRNVYDIVDIGNNNTKRGQRGGRYNEMIKKIIILALAVVMMGGGWAIRSTFIMENYVNKPLGGAMITIGGLLFVGCLVWLFSREPKNHKIKNRR
jgi:hypothetical protein